MDSDRTHADSEYSKNSQIYHADVLRKLKAFVSQPFLCQELYRNISLIGIYRR